MDSVKIIIVLESLKNILIFGGENIMNMEILII